MRVRVRVCMYVSVIVRVCVRVRLCVNECECVCVCVEVYFQKPMGKNPWRFGLGWRIVTVPAVIEYVWTLRSLGM